ncbi:hypothetical protein U9R90_26810 [Streptomyces sp. E11-3]|uniref:hypothetical protein n=1 Tax=Streptomyces sp. E11-3 TaxID=3110112 RepID=UPI0039816CD2
MIDKRASRRWTVAVLTACAVLASGCSTAPVHTDELPGVYRNDETGGEIRIDPDGTFSATDISAAEATLGGNSEKPLDFGGQWDFTCARVGCDFIYLEVDNGELSADVDIQLYLSDRVTVAGIKFYSPGEVTVYLHPDVDGPPSLELTKVAAS